ncbi:putative transmembrane protein [hydrothermal vent metagenome]|uniref:Putative transmembrane protein n=1 Tax=hydrothermal vent metagenome TaxID=652676 RepID=A0A1W1BQ06_9ZZZZ
MTQNTKNNAGLTKRFGAIFYDTLLLFSLLFFMGLIYEAIFGSENIAYNSPNLIFYQLYLFLIILFYFVFSWIKTGQTLGMKAWKLQLVQKNNQPLSLKNAFIYFFSALISWIFLWGFLIALFNTEKQTFHNKISRSYLINLVK